MRAAVWLGETTEVKDVPVPKIDADEVLISVAYSGICQSDIHLMAGGLPADKFFPPRILGHEFSGTITEVGCDVKGFKVGDRVVAHPQGPCGGCYFCRNKMENYCTNIYSIISSGKGGSFAEYIAVKAKQVYKIGDKVKMIEGALVEPVAIALHCVDQAKVKVGDAVLVVGGGPIGLLCMQIASMSGASKVIISEPDEYRRKIALETGADVAVNPLTEDLSAVIAKETGDLGVDVAFEAIGFPKAIEQAFAQVAIGGTLVIVGWPPMSSTITLSPYLIYRREITIKGSFFSPYSFERSIKLLPKLKLDAFMTHAIDLEDFDVALKVQKNRECIKTLVKVHGE